MRFETEQTLAYRTTYLRFTKAERAALERASAIAATARETIEARCGGRAEVEMHDFLADVDVVLGTLEYNHLDIIEGIMVEEQETDLPALRFTR